MKKKKVNIMLGIIVMLVIVASVSSVSILLADSKKGSSQENKVVKNEKDNENKVSSEKIKKVIANTDENIAQEEDKKEKLNYAIDETKHRLSKKNDEESRQNLKQYKEQEKQIDENINKLEQDKKSLKTYLKKHKNEDD